MSIQSKDELLQQTNEPQERQSLAKYACGCILISVVTLFFVWAEWGFHLRWLKHGEPVGPLPANEIIEAAPANTAPAASAGQTKTGS